MSTKPRKPRSSPVPARPGHSAIVPAAPGEIDSGNELPDSRADTEAVDYSGLSHRQRATLPVVAFAPTIAQAARFSGVAESTLRRWLANPDFRQHVDRMREETIHVAHQELKGLLPTCAAVFADAMRSPDPALRLRAARYAISFILRVNEADQISADLQGLQAAARKS